MSFQVGDRVECVEEYGRDEYLDNDMVGMVGTVRVVDRGFYCGVEFDEAFDGGHDLYWNGTFNAAHGHGWWLPADHLTRVGTTCARNVGSIGEFFKKLEAQACTSGYCSSQSS